MNRSLSALKSVKGWAVACLSKVGVFSRKNKGVMTALATAAAALLATHPALAATNTDLFSSQQATVDATFGHGSSIEKWFYIGEVMIALFTYIKVRSPLVFAGIAVVIIFTRIAFGVIG